MKKYFAIALCAVLASVSLFTIPVSAIVNTPEYIRERFALYGYTPDAADIEFWGRIRRNQWGNLEQNLSRRFSQNKYLEVIIPGPALEPSPDEFGAATPKRPTEFKSNLAEQKTEGHSDTTLKVTTITTKDGNTLDAAILGDFIVLSINPGKTNAEVVACTGLTTATKTFTGCTFGYRFDNPTATQASNVEAHAPGEPVIISNTDTYLATQYVTIDGDNTFLGKTTVATSTVDVVRFYMTTSTQMYLWADKATNQMGWATSASEFAFNSGGTTFTAIAPLTLTSGELKIATSSVTAWFGTDSSGKLIGNASTTGGIKADANGIAFDESDSQENLTGDWNFGGAATFTTEFIVGSDYTKASGTALVALTDRSVANFLHAHRPVMGDGVASTTGNLTITHNLGVVPSFLEVHGNTYDDSTDITYIQNGYATSTVSERSHRTLIIGSIDPAYGENNEATSTDAIIEIEDFNTTDRVVADLTTLNSTQFVINFTTFSAQLAPYRFVWVVWP